MIDTDAGAIARVVDQFVKEELSQENPLIAGAVWAMLDAGGKRVRPRMTMLAGEAANAGAPADPVLASYMELIHVATLIHDDVVDMADLRRGRASTNRTHGNRFSVLAGDYLFAWVFKKITQTYASPVPTILAAMLSDICNGEVRQLRATGNADLEPARYFEIIERKTAALFASCAECGAIVALQHDGEAHGAAARDLPAVRALRDYGWRFGIAFQIRDDLLDVTEDEATIGKPAGSDLREKKVTLPLLFALETDPGRIRPLVDRLFSHPDASAPEAAADVRAVIDAVRAGAGVARCERAVAEHATAAQQALGALAQSPAVHELRGLASSLSDFSR